jgi:hypothetical protein
MSPNKSTTKRKADTAAPQEEHSQDSLNELVIDQLKAILKDLKLPVGGKKQVLIDRILTGEVVEAPIKVAKVLPAGGGSNVGLDDPEASGIAKQTQKKYTTRGSPPYSGAECAGMKVRGNDGEIYISTPNKNEVYAWKKV